jgi:hypothetical protein
MRLLAVLLLTGGLRAASAAGVPTSRPIDRSPLATPPDTVGEYRGTYETGFEVSAELKAVLLAAMAGCDRGEKVSAEELLRELQHDECRRSTASTSTTARVSKSGS